jgi:nucleoside-triphosphatase
LNILLTGPPGVGKTTLLAEIKKSAEEHGHAIGGVYCPEVREDGRRTGFSIVDIHDQRRGTLASLRGEGPSVGKYKVNLKDLESIGISALKSALKRADYIFIDEIAPMELKSSSFSQAVWKALENHKTVIAVVHQRSRHPFILKVKNRDDVMLLDLSSQNRNSIREKILEVLGMNKEIKGQ